MRGGRHILILVQNLPVPLDRRVWLECQALIARGYDVSVICPSGPGDPERQTIDGVRLYKYKPAPDAVGLAGYVREFAYSWLRTAWLSVVVWRDRPFQVIQACNPPDTYWLLGRLWRRRGVRFIFDHHDLNPELFLSRFGTPRRLRERLELRLLTWLERRTFRTAEQVISTNESYKRVAIERGGHRPSNVTVVRSGPDTRQMRPIRPVEPSTGYILAYLGIMGPQDGVDTILEVMRELVQRRGRDDVRAILMGFGDCLAQLRQESRESGLDAVVTFTGRVGKNEIATVLSAADVGLCPDLKSPLNDVSTMNKTMEYMAYCLPSVSFDLVETQVSGAETVQYVASGDIVGFADAIERLLDDADLREDLGLRARRRVVEHLDWRPQADAYVGVYDRMFDIETRASAELTQVATHDDLGRAYVDLDDERELRLFIRHRGRSVADRGR
jgi:glycosyltransferase involved in cell wall biosynthesis